MTVAEAILSIRQRRHQTQTWFGDDLGVTHASVSRYEAGKIKPSRPVLKNLLRMAIGDQKIVLERALGTSNPLDDLTPLETDELTPELEPALETAESEAEGPDTRTMSPAEIRVLRFRLRLSQMEFGRLLGVRQANVSRYEQGRITPSLAVLRHLRDLSRRLDGDAEDLRDPGVESVPAPSDLLTDLDREISELDSRLTYLKRLRETTAFCAEDARRKA